MSDTVLDFGGIEAFNTHRSITCIRAKHICKDLGFEKEWTYFLNYNKAASLQYHNRYHSCWMVAKCFDMAEQMEIGGEDLKALVLAALFHDFNHSGGIVSDHVNVANAVQGLLNATEVTRSDPFLSKVIRTLSVTQFPFVRKPETLAEQVIRDADILQGCTVHFAKTIYVDLYGELQTSKGSLSFIDFRKGQEAFLKGVEMFTPIGKAEHKEFLETLAPFFWRRFDKWAD